MGASRSFRRNPRGQVANASVSVMAGAKLPSGLEYVFVWCVWVSVTVRVYSTLVAASASTQKWLSNSQLFANWANTSNPSGFRVPPNAPFISNQAPLSNR